MSIKEALERGSTDRPGTKLTPEQESDYTNKILEEGIAVHREAHVPETLGELAEIIKPNFPDVIIKEASLDKRGLVVIGIKWNFRNVLNYFGRNYSLDVHDEILVGAHSLTRDLIITSKTGRQLVEHSKWLNDSRQLEEAIVNAYRNPREMIDDPSQIVLLRYSTIASALGE